MVAGRSLGTINLVAPLGHIQIQLQNPAFAQADLQQYGNHGFLGFAQIGALAGEIQVLGELLGNGGPPGNGLAGFHVAFDGIANAVPVEAGVLGKAGILGNQHGALQVVADLIIVAPGLLHLPLGLGALHIGALGWVMVL